jgi:hypothetical protein
MWAYRFICDNGHEVFGKEFGGEHECMGPGWTECPSNCACCPHDDGINCDCPFCRGELTATDCTCAGVSGGTSTTLKFTQPLLTHQDVSKALKTVDLSVITVVDGDDPVYEISERTFSTGYFPYLNEMENLTAIKFNYVTNVGEYAFNYAFSDCFNLRTVEFSRLEHVEPYAFHCAFLGSKALSLSFPKLTNVNTNSFYMMESLAEIALPEVERIEDYGFQYSGMLKRIVIPKCQYIGREAFYYTGLKFVNLPSMSIDDYDTNGIHRATFPPGCRIQFKDGEVIAPELPNDFRPGWGY